MREKIYFTLKSLFSNVGLRLLLGLIATVCFVCLAILMSIYASRNVSYSGPLTAGAITSIMVAFVIATLSCIGVVNPLHKLLKTAKGILQNSFGIQVSVKSKNEFRQLEELLNTSTRLWQKKYNQELESAHQHLKKTFDRISQAVTSVLDLEELLTLILDIAKEEIDLEKVLLYLADRESSSMKLDVSLGLDGQRERFNSRNSKEVAARVAQGREPLLGKSKDIFPEFAAENSDSYTLAAPLVIKDEVLGVIVGQPRQKMSCPSKEDVQLFLTLANQAAIAIQNSRLYNETQLLAITDGLTRTYNHRFFQERLFEETARAARFQHPLSLLMIDIDHFKVYNDTYGHIQGDEILKEIAKILDMVSRETDIVARYGGEEFTMLLPETPHEGAKVTAEKIVAAIGDHHFPGSDPATPTHLTVSIGVATYPREATCPSDLLRKADQKMYEAKRKGRNQVC